MVSRLAQTRKPSHSDPLPTTTGGRRRTLTAEPPVSGGDNIPVHVKHARTHKESADLSTMPSSAVLTPTRGRQAILRDKNIPKTSIALETYRNVLYKLTTPTYYLLTYLLSVLLCLVINNHSSCGYRSLCLSPMSCTDKFRHWIKTNIMVSRHLTASSVAILLRQFHILDPPR